MHNQRYQFDQSNQYPGTLRRVFLQFSGIFTFLTGNWVNQEQAVAIAKQSSGF